MAAAAILDNFEWRYLRSGSRSTYSAHRAVIFAIAQLFVKMLIFKLSAAKTLCLSHSHIFPEMHQISLQKLLCE